MFLDVLKKSPGQRVFLYNIYIVYIYILAASLKDRLAPWLVMASDLGPRDLKARGSTFCCK